MPKLRTYLARFGRDCQEVKPGVWRFSASGLTWEFDPARLLTLAMVSGEEVQECVRVASVDEAVAFAEGFITGKAFGRREALGR